MATELTGVFTHLDENGNEIELYPKVKTDITLSKSGEPADAKTVGDKFAEKVAYLPGKLFDTVDELLNYATSLLKKNTIAFMPIGLTDSSNVVAPYSSGFITIKYDTCSVVLFRYSNGRVYVNSKVATGDWIGWKTMAFHSELGKLQDAVNMHNNGVNITVPTYPDFDEGTDTHTYFKNVLKWICTNYPGVSSRSWMFASSPNSWGWSVVYIYDTNDTVEGLPRYASGIYIPLTNGTGEIFTYGCNNGNYVHKTNTPSPKFTVSGSADNATLTINLD